MTALLIILILVAVVSKSARNLLSGVVTLLFGVMLLIIGNAIV